MLFQAGDEWSAIGQIAKTSLKVKQLVASQCQGAPEDIKLLVNWIEKRMSSKQAMVDATSANAHIHSQEIYLHVEELWPNMYGPSGFKPQNPDQLGTAIGSVAYWALGPVKPTYGWPISEDL